MTNFLSYLTHLQRLECIVNDITLEEVDAVVNAANSALAGGGGVDGAIHRAAGPRLLEACRLIHPAGCPTGEARLTPGFDLPARLVIHAVGPVWHGGGRDEPDLLAAAYRSAMIAAASAGATSIAFPAISCGVYGYPHEQAARIAIHTVAVEAERLGGFATLRFVLFDESMRALFERVRLQLVEDAQGGACGGR